MVMKYKEAKLIVNKMLVDFAKATKVNEEFVADLPDRDKVKVYKAIDEYVTKLEKLQVALVINFGNK